MNEQEIIALASKCGAEAAMKKLDDERKQARKEAVKARQHNIKLLLRNYRDLKASVENAIYEAETSETALDILEDLMMPGRNPNLTIESVKRSAARTAILMEHVDAELYAFKFKCERSKSQKVTRQWDIVYWMYIADEPKTMEDLATEYICDKRTLYYDLNNAYETLAALMFGLDGLSGR